MNKSIHIFIGSQSDFKEYLISCLGEDALVLYFMQLIKDYNANLRQQHIYTHDDIDVDNLVVNANDYASVYEHVIQNFITIVTTNHNVNSTFLHNPPERVIKALSTEYGDRIVYKNSSYEKLDEVLLKKVWNNISKEIIGQEKSKKETIACLNKLCNPKRIKPVVLLFYGESGVGKTETAKVISKTLNGELLRIQFSMMQTQEAYNYIYGAEHSKSSFAKDLLARETNIVLIDEFDKVHPNFYNAFYQMFDEGIYADTNYIVNLSNCIFICTSNFMNKKDIMSKLGMPIYSRFDNIIMFDSLSVSEKEKILDSHFVSCIKDLDQIKQDYVMKSDILEWHKNHLSEIKSVRTLRNSIENAINMKIVEKFIINS